MASYFLAPDPCQSTFFIPGGNTPASGGQLFFYAAGSSTKQNVYQDNAGNTAWSNPIVLDSGGNLPSGGEVWFTSGQTYKVVFAPSNDTDPPGSPYWTKDNLSGVNDVTTTGSEWLAGPTPTFVSATSFTLVGDQTATFTVGRRIKTTNTGGTVYSRISTSVFGALTTITVVNDSGVLDSGLSAVSYGILNAANTSVPVRRTKTALTADETDVSKLQGWDLSGLTTSTQVNLAVQNTSGVLAYVSEFAYGNLSSTLTGRMLYPPAYVQGLVPTITAANSISVSAGVTVNSSGAQNIILAAAMEKSLTSTWAPSTAAGGLIDAGSISTNIWYYGHLIKSTTTGWVDVGYSSSYAAPALPTGYTVKSNVPVAASRVVSGSSNSFTAIEMSGGGLEYLWTTPVLDVDALQSTTANLRTLSGVPVGFRTKALLNVYALNASNVDAGVYISSPDVSDQAASITASPLLNIYISTDSAADAVGGYVTVRTDASAQIRTRALQNNTTTRIATVGFEWSRR